MKATAKLGMLPIMVEADDYKELVRQVWKIYKLNDAAVQEGLNPDECMPYCELGADGNEYAGFIHLPSGGRIRFGQQKQQTGGDWFVRGRDSDSYKGVESWNVGTSNQLPEATISGKAKQTPTGGDGAPDIQTWSEKLKALEGYLFNAQGSGNLSNALKVAANQVSKYPEQQYRRAQAIIDKYLMAE